MPTKPWSKIAAWVLGLTLVALTGWEVWLREQGVQPTYNDNEMLWCDQYDRALAAGPDDIVFLGASRTLFDIDLRQFGEPQGPTVSQLAIVGTSPLEILKALAAEENYRATTIVGAVPQLVTYAGGHAIGHPRDAIKHCQQRTPADRFGHQLALALESLFVFIDHWDFSLRGLINLHLTFDNREGVHVPPFMPSTYDVINTERQAHLAERFASVPADRARLRAHWLSLMHPRHMLEVPKAEKLRQRDQQWQKVLPQFVEAVQKIHARGGLVVFVRHPSSGEILDFEREYYPRQDIWQTLVNETGAGGIHFEDDPELKAYDCPEWSHLKAADITTYSQALRRRLESEGFLGRLAP